VHVTLFCVSGVAKKVQAWVDSHNEYAESECPPVSVTDSCIQKILDGKHDSISHTGNAKSRAIIQPKGLFIFC
jgi:hypothetical protein